MFDKGRTTMTQTTGLQIVWRNPKAHQRRQGWELLSRDSRMARYLVQEFLSTDGGSIWVTTSSLDVVAGGRAA